MNINYEREKIIELIENHAESEYLDFKVTPYYTENLLDFIKDVLAFLNADSPIDRYIILGVEDKTKRIIGIDTSYMLDSADYQKIIIEKIEPEASIESGCVDYQNKVIGFIKILSSNNDKPYMIKNDYQKNGKKIDRGLMLKRKGSSNVALSRNDLDKIYLIGGFDITFKDYLLLIAPIHINRGTRYDFDPTYGMINLIVRNYAQRPVTINSGNLEIISEEGKTITEHNVIGIGNIDNVDHYFCIEPNSEKILPIFTSFTSGDCITLNLDDDGVADDKFSLKLTLQDINGNIYIATLAECIIKAKGPILHKIQLKYQNMRVYLKKTYKKLQKAIAQKDYKTIESIMMCPDIDFKLVKADHVLNADAFPETHMIFESVKLAVELNDKNILDYFLKIGLDKNIILKAEGKKLNNELPTKDFQLWDDVIRKKTEDFLKTRSFDL